MQVGYIQDVPLGYFQIAAGGIDTATVIANLAAAVPLFLKGECFLVITAEAQAVRWRDDGTAPTASVGMPLAVGVERVFTGRAKNLQFIAVVAGAVLNVTVYGQTGSPG